MRIDDRPLELERLRIDNRHVVVQMRRLGHRRRTLRMRHRLTMASVSDVKLAVQAGDSVHAARIGLLAQKIEISVVDLNQPLTLARPVVNGNRRVNAALVKTEVSRMGDDGQGLDAPPVKADLEQPRHLREIIAILALAHALDMAALRIERRINANVSRPRCVRKPHSDQSRQHQGFHTHILTCSPSRRHRRPSRQRLEL